jgi:2,4-dienoyl-CoA reductase-like NADH-dependent reductase (Old Yellow Enzyme family)
MVHLFEPLTIKQATFKNRLIRSSIGGRSAYYDGTVNSAWKSFELRFAKNGIGGIISATFAIDDHRWSPIEYPKISDDRFIPDIREGVRGVQAKNCRYILQIGDPGYHTQTSLFSQHEDELSASGGFDLLYGYRSFRTAMTVSEIHKTVRQFADAARRAKECECDGVEVTASKGYILHQFLNPGINRRPDQYGGSPEKRFRFLEEVVQAVRDAVGPDFLFGVRLSANDYNYLPLNVRWPWWPSRRYKIGNTLEENLDYGRKLKKLGVDYLHIDNGFGFINPMGNPGRFPVDEVRMFCNSTRHLSRKAAFRAIWLNMTPRFLLRWLTGIGWKARPAVSLSDAARFRKELGMPVIVNGGFQKREDIDRALAEGCDLVSMARPLLANPDLPLLLEQGKTPEKPCTYCNRCAVRTTLFPLGCYEPSRFNSQAEMEQQILEWNTP